MIKVNRRLLEDFHNRKGCMETTSTMKKLEAFYKISDNGRFELARKVSKRKLKKALSVAVNKKVKQIVFVSLINPFPKLKWMTEEAYKRSINCLWFSLCISLRDSLGDSLKYSLRSSLKDNLENDLKADLWKILWISLGNNLIKSIEDNHIKNLGGNLVVNLCSGIWDSLFYFTGFSLINDTKHVSQIQPLLHFLTKIFVVGEKHDEPGTWIVIIK